MSQSKEYATFYLNGEYLGIDVLRVQEILAHQPMTPVPRGPKYVAGLINLRGQIVAAIDLREKMQMPSNPDAIEPMNIIVRGSEVPTSFIVDRVGDVIEVSDNALEAGPDSFQGPISKYMVGVHKLEKSLLTVIDVDKIVNPSSSEAA